MSNIDVVITLANGSTPYYGIVVNTEADVHISNMAITLPNSTVINTGPMILYISTYHQDIYDIIMPAAGFTEDFIKSLGNNDGQIIKVKLQSNNTITQSLGPLLAPTDDDDDYESDPERDFASDLDEIIESNMNSTPIPIYYHPSYKS
ncbi:hypothetical protein QFC19_009434 [Naganishia cerealis]|uniref:Uncharacterized protein n=1 Tax=Naganishia cerealis TaxID=610337 RepID=A0ACC2UUJ7_9TREE|nr:hypothetical protein QFC19_009434 [Naganishia cerealis]